MNKDINGNNIEIGDVVIRPSNSFLVKSYVLGFTKGGNAILSCKRTMYSNSKTAHVDQTGYNDLSSHNGKQTPPYGWGQMLIIEKNAEIPEQLQKFIRR